MLASRPTCLSEYQGANFGEAQQQRLTVRFLTFFVTILHRNDSLDVFYVGIRCISRHLMRPLAKTSCNYARVGLPV